MRPPEGSARPSALDHARRHRPGEPVRVADGDHELPHPEVVCVTELDVAQVAHPDAHDGKVGERVPSYEVELGLAPVGEGGGAAVRSRHHVRGGQQVAVRGEDDGAACALSPGSSDAQGRDRRDDALGHGDHDGRVGIECLGFIERRQLVAVVQEIGHSSVGPSVRTWATPTSASRNSASHSPSWPSTNFTHHARASLRLRATPASMRVSSTLALAQAQACHDGRVLRREQGRGAVELDAPGDAASESTFGFGGDGHPGAPRALAELVDGRSGRQHADTENLLGVGFDHGRCTEPVVRDVLGEVRPDASLGVLVGHDYEITVLPERSNRG